MNDPQKARAVVACRKELLAIEEKNCERAIELLASGETSEAYVATSQMLRLNATIALLQAEDEAAWCAEKSNGVPYISTTD